MEQNINALAEEIEEYDLIQSIPGIGNKIAATILSEVGKIDRFDHPKQLVAFVGIVPSVFASGKFTEPGIESPNVVLGSFVMRLL